MRSVAVARARPHRRLDRTAQRSEFFSYHEKTQSMEAQARHRLSTTKGVLHDGSLLPFCPASRAPVRLANWISGTPRFGDQSKTVTTALHSLRLYPILHESPVMNGGPGRADGEPFGSSWRSNREAVNLKDASILQAQSFGRPSKIPDELRNLYLEKSRIKYEWRDRCNCYPSAARVPVINQHIAIRRAGDRHDDRRNHKNEFDAFIEPRVPERLGMGFA